MCSSRMEPRWIHSFCWLSWVTKKKDTIIPQKSKQIQHKKNSLNNNKWHWPEKQPVSSCSPPPAPHTSAGLHLILHWCSVQPCTGLNVGTASPSGISSRKTCEGCQGCRLKCLPLSKINKDRVTLLSEICGRSMVGTVVNSILCFWFLKCLHLWRCHFAC